MRIPSGKTDQRIYFVAVDATDLKTRETGLTDFTVYRSRNGGAAVAYTTPTIAETSAANMPGVYSLLIDEDTTIGGSSFSEEYALHITCTGMAPVTRTIELFTDPNTAIAAVKAKTDNLPGDPADASDIAASFATVNSTLGTISGFIDTEVAAIKAKTDNLPSDPADASDIAGAFSVINGKLDTIDDFIDTEVAAIKAKTDNLPADTSATLAAIQADTDNIQTRLPAALVSGRMDSNVSAVNDDATGAARLAKTTRAIGRGTVGGGSTTTSITTSAMSPTGAAADQFKGRIITFDADTATVALRGQSTDITASTNAAAPTFTVSALTTAPSSGDTFSVT